MKSQPGGGATQHAHPPVSSKNVPGSGLQYSNSGDTVFNSWVLEIVLGTICPWREWRGRRPEEYRWTSASAHIAGRGDLLVRIAPLQPFVRDWRSFLSEPVDEDQIMVFKSMKAWAAIGESRFQCWARKEFGPHSAVAAAGFTKGDMSWEGTGIGEISMVSPEFLVFY